MKTTSSKELETALRGGTRVGRRTGLLSVAPFSRSPTDLIKGTFRFPEVQGCCVFSDFNIRVSPVDNTPIDELDKIHEDLRK